MILNLNFFNNIPLEVLSKYLVRCYSFDSEFYKTMNMDLMKSKMKNEYKTFIKLLYLGIENHSLSPFKGKYLYRGAKINKSEYDKIIKYKNNRKLKNIMVFSKAFLSFSEDKDEAEGFIQETNDKEILKVLYELENINKNSTESNADIQEFSAFPEEKEILFLPGSSFTIKDITTLNKGFIKISLNYYGKFIDNYEIIYGNRNTRGRRDGNRFNEIIKKNTLTKIISGKEYELLNGEYLILEKNLEKNETKTIISNVMKAKNLKSNEIVIIKEINKQKRDYEERFNQLEYLIKKANDISTHTCNLKNTFEIDDSIYMEVAVYDDNLKSYLEKISPLGLPPNFIKKILFQLSSTLKGLENEIGERYINPRNILIKYTNILKDNFDVFLSENGIFEFEKNLYSYFFSHPDILRMKINLGDNFKQIDNKIILKNQLFSLGMTIFELYKNKMGKSIKKENKLYGNYLKEEIGLSSLIEPIEEKQKKWIKDLKDNKNSEDELLVDLIDDLTGEQKKIKSYNDVFNHKFFSQYKY